jgi:DNA-binding transcriptional LysR family regulator
MNFTHLRAFAAVARTGSVGRAAAGLRVSPAAISLHLRDLERGHGVVLVERVRRRARLTPAGDALYEYARRIFALSDEADEALALMRDSKTGVLRLGATDTPARSWVPRLLAPFRARYPGVRVELYVGNTRQVLDRLSSRETDVAVVAAAIDDRQLVAAPLGYDPVVVIVPSGHSWRTRRSIALGELSKQPLILREPGSSTRQLVQKEFERRNMRLELAMELGSHDAIIGAVEQGLGVSLVPRSLLVSTQAGVPSRAGVHPLRVRDGQLRHMVSVVHHQERGAYPLTGQVLEIARTIKERAKPFAKRRQA